MMRCVKCLQLFAHFFDVRSEQLYALQVLYLVFIQIPDAVDLDQNAPLDPSPTTLLHATPVLETISDQCVRRYRGDDNVLVRHFHRGKVDHVHITICSEFWHRYPIANTHHIIGADLYACHEPKDRVLEDQ